MPSAEFEAVKQAVSESVATLSSAARTIRSLLVQRNDALAAAKPADVKAATEARMELTEAKVMESALEIARQDCEAAVSEAGATPVIVPKPATPAPKP